MELKFLQLPLSPGFFHLFKHLVVILADIPLNSTKAAYFKHLVPCSERVHATIFQTFVIQFN